MPNVMPFRSLAMGRGIAATCVLPLADDTDDAVGDAAGRADDVPVVAG